MRILSFIILFTSIIYPQIKFDDFFLDKALRIDYYHTGNSKQELYSIDELKEEPFWGGSKVNLIDKFNYGKYKVMVYDESSNRLIYSRTYATLFSEWLTTDEAKITTKTFSETVIIPYPKNSVKVEFYSRDKRNELHKKFEYVINPDDYFISEERSNRYKNFEVLHSGSPAVKVDIVIIPDGYTEDETEKFKDDCDKFAGYLFGSSPFRENKEKFNIWGVIAPSENSGTDIPADNIWKSTAVGTSFYTFDTDRYLMTIDNKKLSDRKSVV